MPLRGENIGTAYVRIIADGDGLDESIRRSFDESEPSVRQAGERNADQYTEAFNRKYRRSFRGSFKKNAGDMFKEANDALTDSLVKLKLSENFFGSDDWHTFRKRLTVEFGDAGSLAGQRLEERFRDSADLAHLADQMKNIGPQVRRAQADLLNDLHSDALRMNRDFDRLKLKNDRDMLAEAFNMNKQFNLAIVAARKKAEKDADSSNFDRFRREHSGIRRLITDIDRLGDAGGSAFGRGSRNNFLNFTGSVVRNLIRSLSIIPRLLGPISDGIAHMVTGFTEGAAKGQSFFSKLANGAAGGAAALAELAAVGLPALAAMVGAAALAVAALGPLISIVSGLVAGVTALAGAISFGLIGAIAPLVGLLAPLGLGLGVALLGVLGLVKHSKALKSAMAPLTKEFKELRDVAAAPLLDRLDVQARRLAPVLDRLKPFVNNVALAFSDMFFDLIQSLNSPGFTRFMATMQTFVPNALRSLNRSILGTFGGLGGIFTALIPVTNEFLGWLERITSEFSKWANSVRGQRELRTFFHDAAQSAKDLGRLLRETGGLISDLFNAGRGQGNSMLRDLTGQVKDLRNFIARNPSGLKDWFNNGLDTMRSVGRVIRDITKALAQLDTPENRLLGRVIFSGLSTGIKLAAFALKLLLPPVKLVINGFRLLNAMIAESLDAFAAFADNAGTIADLIGKLPGMERFKSIGDSLHNAADGARDLADHLRKPMTAKVNTKDAKADIGALRNQVDHFPKSWTSRAIAKVANAKADVGALRNQIDKFPKSHTTGFLAKVGAALIDVGRLKNSIGGVHGKDVTLGARVGSALSAVTALRVGIDSLHDKTITITTRNKLVGSTSGKAANPTLNAAGGVFPAIPRVGHLIRIAEVAGQPEAVVPLNRPLSQVDPSVRLLSAIAQGKIPGMAGGGVVPAPGGRNLEIGELHLHSPSENPKAAANEFLNALVATSY